jgi:hypothetical protein
LGKTHPPNPCPAGSKGSIVFPSEAFNCSALAMVEVWWKNTVWVSRLLWFQEGCRVKRRFEHLKLMLKLKHQLLFG